MKISVKKMDFDRAMALPRPEHKLPQKVGLFWRLLIRLLTVFGMAGTKFKYEQERMELLRVYEGQLDIDYGDEIRTVLPGQLAIIGPRQSHRGLAGPEGVYYKVIMVDISSFYSVSCVHNFETIFFCLDRGFGTFVETDDNITTGISEV